MSEDHSDVVTVYVQEDFKRRRLVFSRPRQSSIAQLQDEIKHAHQQLYPRDGQIHCQRLIVSYGDQEYAADPACILGGLAKGQNLYFGAVMARQRPGQHGLEVPNDDIIDDSGSEELTEPIQTSSIPMTPEQIQLSSSQVLSPEGLQPQNPLQSSDPLENPNLDKPSFHEEIFQGSLPDMHYNPEQENDLFQPSHPGVRDLPKADTQSEEVREAENPEEHTKHVGVIQRIGTQISSFFGWTLG